MDDAVEAGDIDEARARRQLEEAQEAHAQVDAGDSSGEGPTGHPESVQVAFTPGTYFVGAVNFSTTNPSIFQLTLHNP